MKVEMAVQRDCLGHTGANKILRVAAATAKNVILGTPGYMSPEQARGRTADRRTDIFAYGCLLYEMLTGRRTFEGETLSDTLAAVLPHTATS